MLMELLLGTSGLPESSARTAVDPAGQAPESAAVPFQTLFSDLRNTPQHIENNNKNIESTGTLPLLSKAADGLPAGTSPALDSADPALALPQPAEPAALLPLAGERAGQDGLQALTPESASDAGMPSGGNTLPPAGNELPSIPAAVSQVGKALLDAGKELSGAEPGRSKVPNGGAVDQRSDNTLPPAASTGRAASLAAATEESRALSGLDGSLRSTLEPPPVTRDSANEPGATAPRVRTPLSLAIERSHLPALELPGDSSARVERGVPSLQVAGTDSTARTLPTDARLEALVRVGETPTERMRAEATAAAAPRAAMANTQPQLTTPAAALMPREATASPSPSVLEAGVELAPLERPNTVVAQQRGLPPALVAVPGAAETSLETLSAGRESQLPNSAQMLGTRPLAAAQVTAAAPAVAPLMTLERVQLLQDAAPKTARSLPLGDQADGNRRSLRSLQLQLDGALAMDPTAVRAQTPEAQRADGVLSRADNAMAEQALPQLARDVLRMAAQNATQLRLQLNPEELGALDVRLRVDGDRVHVSVVAQQGLTRELLEAQLPQLKSLLAEGGLELGDVDVRQHGDNDQQARRSPLGGEGTTTSTRPGPDAGEPAAPAPRPGGGRLVDAFA